jgi:uncharacterized protein
MKYKLSSYHVSTAEIGVENTKRILYSTKTGKTMMVGSDLYDKLLNNDFNRISTSSLNQLFKYELIVPHDENEFLSVLGQNKGGITELDSLGITIQPTANCQLGCNYCGQVHSKENASDDLQQKILDRIEKKLSNTNRYKTLSVMWYGGEPLLGYSQIKSMSRVLQNVSKAKGVNYIASMITNGLSLKPEVFKELYLNHHVYSFQITIDGTKEHHDTRRMTKEGISTYDIILNNIINISKLPDYQKHTKKPILLRINIDKTNYQSVTSLIDILASHDLQDKVSINFSPVINWGDLTYGDELGLSKQEYAKLEIEWFVYSISKGFGTPEIIPSRTLQPCMVVDKDSEVYDAKGNIYPCYEFSYTPMYDNPEHTIGNLKQPEETYTQNVKTRDWYDSELENGKSWCKGCKFFPVCGGGCVKQWYVDEPACPTFKFNMEERLMLDYLLKKNVNINDLNYETAI